MIKWGLRFSNGLLVASLCLSTGCSTYTLPASSAFKEGSVPQLRIDGYVKLPKLPRTEVMRDSSGQPVKVASAVLILETLKRFPYAAIEGVNDSSYVLLTGDSYTQCVAYVRWVAFNYGWMWIAEAWDCDNFSEALAFVTRASLAKSIPDIKAEPLTGRIHVFQAEKFAEVPAGGFHALNFGVVDDFLIVVTEPQNGFSVIAENYPNKNSVNKIKFD